MSKEQKSTVVLRNLIDVFPKIGGKQVSKSVIRVISCSLLFSFLLMIPVNAVNDAGISSVQKLTEEKEEASAESEEQLPEMSAIDSGKIVASVYGTIPFYENNYPDTASLAEASSLVVYGEVLGMEYEESAPWIYTTGVYVKVLQPVKGNCEKDDIIKVGTGQKLQTV